MEHAKAEDIKKHVRVYVSVFVALMALTVITVAVSYLHLPVTAAIIVALVIATIKGSLVASYFMHLISEKKLIFIALLLTVVFFAALIFLPLLGHQDVGDSFLKLVGKLDDLALHATRCSDLSINPIVDWVRCRVGLIPIAGGNYGVVLFSIYYPW